MAVRLVVLLGVLAAQCVGGFAPAAPAPARGVRPARGGVRPLFAKYVDANGPRRRRPRWIHTAVIYTRARSRFLGEVIKPALSAYMHFCNDERAKVTAEVKAAQGAAFKQTQVMTRLGELWRGLGDQAPYKARAADDKARYDAALAANGLGKANAPPKKKRPLSAYMHFCADRRPAMTEKLQAEHGAAFKYTMVMTGLGAEWRELDAGAKARFEDMAAADKAAKAAAA